MAEQLKRFRIHLKSKAGDQVVTLLARNRGEAEMLATAEQQRRAGRYHITMERVEAGVDRYGAMSKEQRKAEIERRKRDFSRYDIVTPKEVGKDENGNPIHVDQIASAESPLTIEKIEEAK